MMVTRILIRQTNVERKVKLLSSTVEYKLNAERLMKRD